MHLASDLTAVKQNSAVPLERRAAECCNFAKQLEKAGEYEAAHEALSEFWPEQDNRPLTDGLSDLTTAQLLLRTGALSAWLGSAQQAGGSQEIAKNLITESLEIFIRLQHDDGVAEGRAELALCYWREGSFDEARINLATALRAVKDRDSQVRLWILIRAGMVEIAADRLDEALRIFDESAQALELSSDHGLRGTFHNHRALLFRRLSKTGNFGSYADRALIEYAAASFHFEKAGHTRYQASVENNLGFLFFTLGRFSEAHKHLNRAGNLFRDLQDDVHLAQVNDTRARALIAEGRLHEAERTARSAVKTLEKGGEQALLAEALTTQGIAMARMGRNVRSKALLERAISVAETAGDLEGAGRATLSFIEELGEQTPPTDLAEIYHAAVDRLQRSQDPSAGKRLIACARMVIEALGTSEAETPEQHEHNWEGFSFRQEIVNCERALIERALRDAGGSVTRAAHLLGFKHHQSLISLINTRHKDLLKTRSAVRKRRRHIVVEKKAAPKKAAHVSSGPRTARVLILHIEDSKLVANLVRELLTAENWQVELCADGDSALRKLTDNGRYDIVLVDSELPGLNGIELVQRARRMSHRRRTPIVMLSGTNCETEAWRAGVDAYLRKPDEINDVPLTIARLLKLDLKFE